VDIPPEIAIRSTIVPGSVFYFKSEALTSPFPHYHVVLNLDPFHDEVIILVCASSKKDKVKAICKDFPADTLVEINKTQYEAFTKDSIFNCNEVFERKIEDLVKRFSTGELLMKPKMDIELVNKLRVAVLSSNQVTPEIQQKLKET